MWRDARGDNQNTCSSTFKERGEFAKNSKKKAKFPEGKRQIDCQFEERGKLAVNSMKGSINLP